MSKNLAEPSTQRILANHGYRVSQLERRPLPPAPWIYVGTWIAEDDPGNDPGTTEDSPPFENGFSNADPLVPVRFRHKYEGCSEVEGKFTGGAVGDTIFTLPADWRCDQDSQWLIPLDDVGTVGVIRELSTGEVVWLA